MLATTKVPNLKANHNRPAINEIYLIAVLATTKVPNLKANHNGAREQNIILNAVLATTKVPNLKANHNYVCTRYARMVSCVSYYESTEFES